MRSGFCGHGLRARSALIAPRMRSAGVTLIELMVVVAISAILLAVGVPMMTTFVDRNRVATQVNELIADVALTRSEAIARRGRVIMCRSANPNADDPTCDGAAADWSGGWFVFIDNTAGGTAFNRDVGEAVVRRFTRTSAQVSVTADPSLAGVTVTADGTMWTLAGAPLSSLNAGAEPLRLDFIGTETPNRRSLCIATSGRARTSNTFGSCS